MEIVVENMNNDLEMKLYFTIYSFSSTSDETSNEVMNKKIASIDLK